MSPEIIALLAAAIQSVGQIASQLASGSITEDQAKEFLLTVSQHYNASVAAWKNTPQPAAKGTS